MGKYSEALTFAASLCSTSEQCAFDILRKTAKFELDTDEKEKMIQALRQNGFIDDQRFVKAFVNDRLHFNKWGRMKIGYMLKQKGIDNTIIETNLNDIDEDAYTETLLNLLKQKSKSANSRNQIELKSKLYRFAQGKGYESSAIGKCLKQMKLDFDETEFSE